MSGLPVVRSTPLGTTSSASGVAVPDALPVSDPRLELTGSEARDPVHQAVAASRAEAADAVVTDAGESHPETSGAGGAGTSLSEAGAQEAIASQARESSLPKESFLRVDFEGPFKVQKDTTVRAFEREYLTRLLARTRGNVARAAREAQLDRKHLYSLLHKYGLLRSGD